MAKNLDYEANRIAKALLDLGVDQLREQSVYKAIVFERVPSDPTAREAMVQGGSKEQLKLIRKKLKALLQDCDNLLQ
jgi:hypothetical protein